MDIGEGLVSNWYRAGVGICLDGNLKERKTNGGKDYKGRGEKKEGRGKEKEERRENRSEERIS